MNICVFCSSSNALQTCYFEAGEALGDLIGKSGHDLVYGGANVGLMEHVAKHVKKSGGKITGIIPAKIHEKELGSALPNSMIVTESMDERKKIMRKKSDAFIALPGGFGTLEEILEVITLKQLDYHQKPIVLVNTNNFYDHLVKQFEIAYKEKFAKENYRDLFLVADTPRKAMEYIENYQHHSIENKWYIVPGNKKK